MVKRVLAGWLLIAVGVAACGPRRAAVEPAGPRPAIELIGEFSIPPLGSLHALAPARFGGISGLAIDPRNQDLLGICDDRADSRVFVFQPVDASAAPFRVAVHAYFPLPMAPAAPPKLDPEGIAITRAGRLFVSSEGVQNQEPRVAPAIAEYTRRADFVRQLEIPDKFLPPATGPITRGVRDNASLESLALSPDERRLFTASETALAQDGEPADQGRGTLARLLEFEQAGDTYVPRREFAYPIDPLGTLDFTPRFFINGLVELVSLGGSDFLSLERGYAEEAGGAGRSVNRIRIFRVSTVDATDISALDSIRARPDIRPARKTLLLDFGDLKGLSPELAALDNFEGMTFGPTLPDGTRTLLVVSDDNFSRRQRTSFLLFRLRQA